MRSETVNLEHLYNVLGCLALGGNRRVSIRIEGYHLEQLQRSIGEWLERRPK